MQKSAGAMPETLQLEGINSSVIVCSLYCIPYGFSMFFAGFTSQATPRAAAPRGTIAPPSAPEKGPRATVVGGARASQFGALRMSWMRSCWSKMNAELVKDEEKCSTQIMKMNKNGTLRVILLVIILRKYWVYPSNGDFVCCNILVIDMFFWGLGFQIPNCLCYVLFAELGAWNGFGKFLGIGFQSSDLKKGFGATLCWCISLVNMKIFQNSWIHQIFQAMVLMFDF